jgi:peptide/nickel transport system substrate-binding protein
MSSTRSRIRAVLVSLVLLPAALLLAGCRGIGSSTIDESGATPRRGGTAVLGSISDVDSWNEYLSQQTFAINLHRRMYLRLAQEQGDTQEHPATFAPLLAESWTFSRDRRDLTFHLRPCAWSDGSPVTAADVVFTWKAQTSPAVAWIGAETKARIEDVAAIDPRTVRFRFERAYPEQLADAVEGGIVPQHVFGRVPFEGWRTHDWSDARVVSGPFRLLSHRPAEEIVLERNPRYFEKDLPHLDRVVVRVVPDVGNLFTQLLAGGIDYLEGLPPQDAERARKTPGVQVIAFDNPMFDYIGWNAKRPPLDDPMVRRAMTLAIDRDAIVEDLLFGYGRVSTGPLLSFTWTADPTLAPWPCSPDEARAILASRGFRPRAGDGVLVRGGKPLEIEITTNAGNRLREAVLVRIQEQLSRIGVVVRPRPLEMKTFRQKNAAGEFDAYVSGWRFSGKVDLKAIFGSAAVPPEGHNVVAYRSPDADRVLDELASASDWTAMRPLFATLARRIHEDQPYTFLYEGKRLAVVGPGLRGVAIDVPADPLAGLARTWVER